MLSAFRFLTGCILVWAAIVRYHRRGVLTFISNSSGGWKSVIGVPAWSDSGESSLSGLQVAVFLLYSHMVNIGHFSHVFS